MKLTPLEKRLLTFCAFVILLFSYFLYDDSLFVPDRETDTEPIAELIDKRQDVRLKFSENFSWTPIRVDQKLHPYDSLFTGDNSTAVLKLQDGSTLRIDGQSLIVLSMYEGKLVLDLKSGSLSGDLGPDSKLLLKTRDGFQNLTGRDGKQFRVEKDFAGQTLQKIGRLPSSIADQLIWKSPKHFRVNKQDPKRYQNLAWIKTAGIKETVIEISSTPDFAFLDKVLKTNGLESGLPMDLPDGSYFVRLRGYTSQKRETAVSTVQSFDMFDQKRSSLLPPTLLTQNLQHSDELNFPPIIRWTDVSLAERYRIEISPTPRFERGYQSETSQTNYPWNEFLPGTYFVRVYSLAEDQVSLPSEIGTLEIMSKAPVLAPIPKLLIRTENTANVGPQKVDLSWKHLGKQSGYRVEISRDGTFRDAQVVEATRGPASLKVRQHGQYHFRVFATNQEGQPISPSSNVEVFNYQLKNLLPPPRLWRPFSETTVFLQMDDNPYLWLDWYPIQDAEKFIVEIAEDRDFKRVIASESTATNRYLIGKKIPYGQYFWRVKSVNETERADSDWSPPNRFYLMHKKKEIFFE
ncbi:MAG: hypothetical protein ACK5Y2_05420 [Bdellovibrionales bacterium]